MNQFVLLMRIVGLSSCKIFPKFLFLEEIIQSDILTKTIFEIILSKNL